MKKNSFFQMLGAIFTPLIPAFVVAGMCSGFSTLLSYCPKESVAYLINNILALVSSAFNKYLTAWVGYSAASVFGLTPVFGGIFGMITILGGITDVAQALNIQSYLHPGSGGTAAVIAGVWILAKLEKFFHRHIAKSVDQIFTPFLSIVICLVPYIFLIMPVMGFLTELLSRLLLCICSNNNDLIRIISGFCLGGLFLPAQLFGLQPAFQTIYILQLETEGVIALTPMLSMAGAGQVGACIAVVAKCRKNGNSELSLTAQSGLVPGILGVGNALLYGVSVPYPAVLLSSCLGSGLGAAFTAHSRVCSTGWGASGLLAIPLMTAGPGSPFINMLNYTSGLAISCLSGLIFCTVIVKSDSLVSDC